MANKKRLRMFEEHIVSKPNNGSNNNYQEEYPDEFVAFHDGHPRSKCTTDCITYSHRYGNGKKYSSTCHKKNNGTKIGSHVYQLGIGTGF